MSYNIGATKGCKYPKSDYPISAMTEKLIELRQQINSQNRNSNASHTPYIPKQNGPYCPSEKAVKPIFSVDSHSVLRAPPQEPKYKIERKMPYERQHAQFRTSIYEGTAFDRSKSQSSGCGSSSHSHSSGGSSVVNSIKDCKIREAAKHVDAASRLLHAC